MAATPPSPAAGAAKPKEVKTDHIRRGATVAVVFVAIVSVAVVVHGIVAPHRAKAPTGIIANTKPQARPQTGETPAALEKEIAGYRQSAATQQGAALPTAGTGGVAGDQAAPGQASMTPAQQRMTQEEAEYIRQQLRQPMQLHDAGDGRAVSAAPSTPAAAGGDVDARLARLNAQLADLKARQAAAGQSR